MNTSKKTRSSARLNKKRLIILITIAVLLLIGMGAAAYMYTNGVSNKEESVSKQESKATEDEPYMLADEIRNIEKELANAEDDEKTAIYGELSNLYSNSEDKADLLKSVEYAQKMVDAQPNFESYSQLAFSYASAGDNKMAAESYRKAAELSEPKVDDGRTDYSYALREAKIYEAKENE